MSTEDFWEGSVGASGPIDNISVLDIRPAIHR